MLAGEPLAGEPLVGEPLAGEPLAGEPLAPSATSVLVSLPHSYSCDESMHVPFHFMFLVLFQAEPCFS